MSDIKHEPKYDVALSFLNEHHALAKEIGEELSARMKPFVYSNEQPELIGSYTDGVEAFTDIFRNQSRVCVVLHSQGWGQKGMTKVESEAMFARVPSEGWNFLIVVCLDNTKPPSWVPDTKIWYGFKEFGLKGLLATIDNRVTELGGRPKQDSVVEKAKRLQRQRDFAQRKHDFLISADGFKAAQAEITHLYDILKARVQELEEACPDLGVSFQENAYSYRSAAAVTQRASLVRYWQPAWANVLTDAVLLAKEWGGYFSYSGWFGGPPEVGVWSINPTINYAGDVVWIIDDGEEPLTSEKLVDFLVDRLLTHANESHDTAVPILRARR